MRRIALLVVLAQVMAAPAARAAVGTGVASAGLATPAAIEHGARSERRIALTFDACTTRAKDPYDPRVTAVLEALHVPATVFVGGGWAAEEPAALRELAGDPLLEIGNHTFTHPHLTRLPDAAIRDELVRTQQEIARITGRTPALFRPPYGEYDGRVVRVAASVGLTTIEYDLPSGDPDPRATAAGLVRWVLREARPGSIVVLHINHRSFPTAEALPAIVAGLRARGFELVTVSELLRDAPGRGGHLVASVRPSTPLRHARDERG